MNAPETQFDPRQDGRHWSRYGLTFLAIAGLFLALITYQIYTSYETAKAAAINEARNLAQVLDSKLYHDFIQAQAAVSAMAAEVEPEAMRPANASRYRPQITRRLKSRISSVPIASALGFFSANGDSLYSSTDNEPAFNIGDRKYFQQLKADPAISVIYSEAVISRFSGRPAMIVTKPVRDKNGEFLGVAHSELELLMIREQFRSIELGKGGAVALRRLDNGASVVRIPGHPVEIDNRPVPDLPVRQAILRHGPTGTIEIKSVVDGIQRIYGYRALGDLPLFVVVGIAENEYLAAWRTSAAISLIASLLFLATLAAVIFRLSSAKLRQEAIMGEMQTILRNAL
ncbi:MAG: cache domain-containing protein, partial [Proteobacteria bacterium]|nr:cache domain-containing protein [Pseudomonadota bacterium]